MAQAIGLFAFFYACVHLLAYVALYANFSVHAMSTTSPSGVSSPWACWLALLVPLALTSTNWSIRKLGGKRWNRLHKLVYVAACAE